jgi:DNA-binding MarR family transcriptional regulator
MTEDEALRRHLSKLGKKGGPKGGRARMASLTPEQRKELAQKAAAARWAASAKVRSAAKKKRAAKGNA